MEKEMNVESETLDFPGALGQLLAEHLKVNLQTGVYGSYFAAADHYHNSEGSSTDQLVPELQQHKSAIARSEYVLIPRIWKIYDDEGLVFQNMLEVTKYDTEGFREVSYDQIIAGTLFHVDGAIQIGALDNVGKCKWHNEYFSEAQIASLTVQANEINQLEENYGYEVKR